ncbi:MAG: hypothetical protein RBT49_06425 [Bacteroidales bacterium]|jgi:hypothetical protein|nr:hypothetical protein [Bacteroidales bacterium]
MSFVISEELKKEMVKQFDCFDVTKKFLCNCEEKNVWNIINWEQVYKLAKEYVNDIDSIRDKIVPKNEWDMKQYLRDKNNQKCGFLCSKKTVDGKVKVYYSFCDTRYDKFDPNYEPKELSFDVKTPYSQFESIICFLQRVVRYYGKDKNVSIPKWIFELFKYHDNK